MAFCIVYAESGAIELYNEPFLQLYDETLKGY
jgi:hypothetical protein